MPQPLDDKDRERCLKLAQLYEEAWNRLREHEWRLEIMFWATLLTLTGVLIGGGMSLFGIQISTPTPPKSFLTTLWWGFFILWILMVTGKIGYQMAFLYFAKNRDFYVRQSISAVNSHLYKWPPTTARWFDPPWLAWHKANTFVVVFSTAFVTGLLMQLSYSMIANTINKSEQWNQQTVTNTVTAIRTNANEGVLRLDDGTRVRFPPEKRDNVRIIVTANDQVEIIGWTHKADSDLHAEKITNVVSKKSVNFDDPRK